MLIAVISDIHANLEAFSSVLARIEAEHADEILCLGDIVGYSANPNECVEKVRACSSAVVCGNHDFAVAGYIGSSNFSNAADLAVKWTSEMLTRTNMDYLGSLPVVLAKDGYRFVHASPSAPKRWNYIMSRDDASREFHGFPERLCFIGHSHRPIFFRMKDDVCCDSASDAILFEEGERYLINVGSVGQPRDGDPRACFALFNPGKGWVKLVRVEYDIQSAQRKILEADLPPILAERLGRGQ